MLVLLKNVKCVFSMVIRGWAVCVFFTVYLLLICPSVFAHPFMTNLKSSNIVIIDDFHPIFIEKLSNAGFNVTYLPTITPKDALEKIKDSDIVAVRSKVNFTAEVIAQCTNLKCIARGGAGMDNIDEIAAEQQHITLLNAPEGNRDAVAEHAIGLLLALSNNIVKSHTEVLCSQWLREENRGFEIGGKIIGIIGYGNTGKAFTQKIKNFNVQILAHDKYSPVHEDEIIKSATLEEIQQKADIISLHIPLTHETKGYINHQFLSNCKKQIVLINTARGKIVDTKAIVEGFEKKTIKAFGTDLLENENLNALTASETLIFKTLKENKNVIITPHIAGWTTESYQKIAEILANKLIEFKTK